MQITLILFMVFFKGAINFATYVIDIINYSEDKTTLFQGMFFIKWVVSHFSKHLRKIEIIVCIIYITLMFLLTFLKCANIVWIISVPRSSPYCMQIQKHYYYLLKLTFPEIIALFWQDIDVFPCHF